MKKNLSKEETDHFIEGVRLVNSNDSAYQHLLDTIAADVKKKFSMEVLDATMGADYVTKIHKNNEKISLIYEYIKNWRP